MATQAATHWDALAHASYGGKIYNGFPAESITAEQGASRCGVDKIPHIVTRGVLLDVARAKGVDRLEGGYALTPDDLDAACELGERRRCSRATSILLRTGQMQLLFAGDKLGVLRPEPRAVDADGRSGSATTTSPRSRPTASPTRCSHRNARTARCRCTCCTSSTWA